ncbi:hypothetical protein D3C73_840050 [compost metagenome]
MPLVQLARRDAQAAAQRRPGAGGFADDGAGRHYARRAEGDVGGADIAPGHQHIPHIRGIQGAEGDVIHPVCMHMLRAAGFGVHPLRGMEIDRPAAKRHAVRELTLGDNVILVQHVVADEPPVFAFAGQRADPFQRHVFGAEFAGVFDIIPNAVNDGPQLVADHLIIMHRVMLAAPFNPPVVAAGVAASDHPAERNRRFRNILGKRRRDKVHRYPRIFGIKQNSAA